MNEIASIMLSLHAGVTVIAVMIAGVVAVVGAVPDRKTYAAQIVAFTALWPLLALFLVFVAALEIVLTTAAFIASIARRTAVVVGGRPAI